MEEYPRGIETWLREIGRELRDIKFEIRRLRHREHAQSGILIFVSKGKITMDATIQVGQSATAILEEFSGPNGTGQQVPNAGPVTITIADATVASLGADGKTLTGLKAGTTQVTGTDATDNIIASATLTVEAPPPPPAVSGVLVLTPVAAAAGGAAPAASAPVSTAAPAAAAAAVPLGSKAEHGVVGDVGATGDTGKV